MYYMKDTQLRCVQTLESSAETECSTYVLLVRSMYNHPSKMSCRRYGVRESPERSMILRAPSVPR